MLLLDGCPSQVECSRICFSTAKLSLSNTRLHCELRDFAGRVEWNGAKPPSNKKTTKLRRRIGWARKKSTRHYHHRGVLCLVCWFTSWALVLAAVVEAAKIVRLGLEAERHPRVVTGSPLLHAWKWRSTSGVCTTHKSGPKMKRKNKSSVHNYEMETTSTKERNEEEEEEDEREIKQRKKGRDFWWPIDCDSVPGRTDRNSSRDKGRRRKRRDTATRKKS